MKARHLTTLSSDDLQQHRVWRFAGDSAGDVLVVPVSRVPVSSLKNRLVSGQVRLGNGDKAWGLFGNLDPHDERMNRHFATLSIERRGKWFHLARYHDIDVSARGPEQLAEFLELPVDQVFPISYDFSSVFRGEAHALLGMFTMEPVERLSRDEVIALAVLSTKST